MQLPIMSKLYICIFKAAAQILHQDGNNKSDWRKQIRKQEM